MWQQPQITAQLNEAKRKEYEASKVIVLVNGHFFSLMEWKILGGLYGFKGDRRWINGRWKSIKIDCQLTVNVRGF